MMHECPTNHLTKTTYRCAVQHGCGSGVVVVSVTVCQDDGKRVVGNDWIKAAWESLGNFGWRAYFTPSC